MDRALFLMGISMSALPPPLFALSLIMEPVHQPMSAAVTATSRGELGARVETLEAGNVTSVLQGGVSRLCSSRGHGHDRELFIIVAKWDILSPLVSIQVLFYLPLLSPATERFRK